MHRALSFALFACLAGTYQVSAQDEASATPQLTESPQAQTSIDAQSASPPVTESQPVEGPSYEDQLIEGGALRALTSEERGQDPYDAKGWPRAWRAEVFTSAYEQQGTRSYENGVVLGAQIDTPHYGAFTLDATLRTDPAQGVMTLWQRGLPFDHWRANNGIGMLNTLSIDLSRNQYRFTLPSFPVRGVVTEWKRGDEVQIQASVGRPGLYSGLRLAGFDSFRGSIASWGAQANYGAKWQGGIQLAKVENVGSAAVGPDIADTARSAYGTLAWQNGDSLRVQANLLNSHVEGERSSTGVWIDTVARQARYRHNFGFFRMERNLTWGHIPVAGDVQGGYYRLHYRSLRWLWDGGLDAVSSISKQGVDGVQVSSTGRYQVSRAIGIGGGASVRASERDSWSAFSFVDRQDATAGGSIRVQIEAAGVEDAQRGVHLILDRNWPMPTGTRLTTSLSASRERSPNRRAVHRTGFAVLVGGDITDKLSIDANLRLDSSRGDTRRTGRYADISLRWYFNPCWSLSATYYDNHDEDAGFLAVDPLIPVTPSLVSTRENRALFLVLRYEDRAGTVSVPLGGGVGSPAGSVVGHLFLDENNNGRRDATEKGSANVTIVLDDRFPTQTDASGKFEFSYVAAGPHLVQVVPDNLPLPWSIEGEDKRRITVHARQTTTLEIPASKLN